MSSASCGKLAVIFSALVVACSDAATSQAPSGPAGQANAATPPAATNSAPLAPAPIAIPPRIPSPLEKLRQELERENDGNKITSDVLKGDVSITLDDAGNLGRKNKLSWAGRVEKGARVKVDGRSVRVAKSGRFKFTVKKSGGQDYESRIVATRKGKEGQVRFRVHRALSEHELGKTFVAGSPDPTYKQLEKDPSAWKGTRVRFRGQIFNIKESEDGAQIQMHVGRGYFGYNSNNLMVVYPKRTPFVRGNVVTIYGTIIGAHSYQSVAGWNISVPAVMAKYIAR